MKQIFFINIRKRYHLIFLPFLVILTLVGCTSNEEKFLERPFIHFEEYLKKDDEIVLVNGEQKLIKELKEEYGILYHMIVEYSDQEIEDIYNSMIYTAYKGYEYLNTNFDKIYTNEIPRILPEGLLVYNHYEEFDLTSTYIKLMLERNRSIYYTTNPIISKYKKYLKKIEDTVIANTLLDNQHVNTRETAIKLLSKKVSEKREQVIFSLTYYEIYLQVEQIQGITFQRVRDSDLNPKP